MQEYLKLADPEEIKKLRSTGEEPKEEIVEEPKEGEKPKMRQEEETRPYLKLFNIIQGTRKITLQSFEKRIPALRERSKIILDDDWLYNKILAIFNQYEPRDVEVGMFYIYNRQFKCILDDTSFENMKDLITLRGQKKKKNLSVAPE